jgi:hypothetical protein
MAGLCRSVTKGMRDVTNHNGSSLQRATRDGVAVIMSNGQTVEWCFMSDGLKQAKGLTWVRKGTPVPAATVTADFNSRPENVRTGQRNSGKGRLNDRMDGERVYRVTEEVAGLGQYGRTLTLLTCRNFDHAR